MAKFVKGQSGNPKGRAKGEQNKKTKMWHALGEYFVTEGAQRCMQILAESPDKDFLIYYEKMLNYFKPKLASQQLTGSVDTQANITLNITD